MATSERLSNEALITFLDALASLVAEFDQSEKPLVGLSAEAFLNRLSQRLGLGIEYQEQFGSVAAEVHRTWKNLASAVQVYRTEIS